MGLIVLNYKTTEGFVVPELYLELNFIRLLRAPTGSFYGCAYSCQAFRSIQDRQTGSNPLPLPKLLSTGEEYLPVQRFYEQTIFGFAYECLKRTWQSLGYTVQDSFSQAITPKTYTYDCSGYNFLGFNCEGWDREKYDMSGFNVDGWDRQGYGRDGFNGQGYDRQGFDRTGYNAQGYDRFGFTRTGIDKDGYDRTGFNAEGFNRAGYDRDGYDRQGFDRNGYDRNGVDKDGEPRPTPIIPSLPIEIPSASISISQHISTLIGISTTRALLSTPTQG